VDEPKFLSVVEIKHDVALLPVLLCPEDAAFVMGKISVDHLERIGVPFIWLPPGRSGTRRKRMYRIVDLITFAEQLRAVTVRELEPVSNRHDQTIDPALKYGGQYTESALDRWARVRREQKAQGLDGQNDASARNVRNTPYECRRPRKK
jgi:hypothetical protein